VNVHAWNGGAHRATYLHIGVAGETRVDAALHTHFGRTALPGLSRAPGNLVQRQIVRAAAQVLAHLAFGEGAELAFERADIGVIDVARDDVRNDVAAGLPSQRIGRRTYRGKLVAARLEQAHDVAVRERAMIGPRSPEATAGVAMCAASGGSATVVPGDHSSVRGQPSASIRCSSAVRRPGSTQVSAARA
jgi:hypothetical protein